MMHLLAEVPQPPPEVLASWLSVFMYLVGIIAAMLGIAVGVKKLRAPAQQQTIVSPQPLEVKAHDAGVSKDEHDKLERKLDAETAKQANSRKGIYTRLEDHSSRITALERSQETTSERLSAMDGKLDANTQLTSAMSGEVKQINQNIVLVLNALTKK